MPTEKSSFTPDWYEGDLPPQSYRSIFKWGAPREFKHPNRRLYQLMKDTFELSDADFQQPVSLGLEAVSTEVPVGLSAVQLKELEDIVGLDNLTSETYARLKAGYGAGAIDALRLHHGIIENIPDVVVHPRHKQDIEQIVNYCNAQGIAVYVYGGGSSVTRGFEAVKGGVTLDMGTHMNKVLAFNETNQTITVQPGIFGPALEDILNHAPEKLGASRAYTCGHFPQSFEYSTVGGWVVTRGAGQNSTYYGKAEDLVLSQEYVTPIGTVKTQDYPRQATGPDLDQIMIGSEGAFGVLVEVTLKVFHYTPENRVPFSYMFKSWEDAQAAARQIMQAEYGYPSVFRISDPEETDVAMKLYGIEGTPADGLLKLLGFEPMQKCLMLGYTDGDQVFSRTLARRIRQTCRSYGAFNLSPFGVTQRWEHGRFRDPYMREDLADYGILIDTLECAVNWADLPKVHAGVRAVVKSRPQTICMTHISHAYPQGANLYFIFIARITDIDEYLKLQYSVLQAIQDNGAAMSHHHGVGKQTAPWLAGQIGEQYMAMLKSLKQHFDPNNIMNPGGTLGLDMSPQQAAKTWGMRKTEATNMEENHVAAELA